MAWRLQEVWHCKMLNCMSVLPPLIFILESYSGFMLLPSTKGRTAPAATAAAMAASPLWPVLHKSASTFHG